jgi:hypothetical protein
MSTARGYGFALFVLPCRPLQLAVWDWDNSSDDDLVGTGETSLAELQQVGAEIYLTDKKGKRAGTVVMYSMTALQSMVCFRCITASLDLGVENMFVLSWGQPSDRVAVSNTWLLVLL